MKLTGISAEPQERGGFRFRVTLLDADGGEHTVTVTASQLHNPQGFACQVLRQAGRSYDPFAEIRGNAWDRVRIVREQWKQFVERKLTA